jgi:ligand-binding sensor domain-containing protein/putative methionine-R-sulfoxide reductase with GAF domain
MRHKLISIMLVCAISMAARAQFIFQNLRWQDGLSAKEIRCLYKDREGFLWIGTSNGLNRFDGAVIKQFKNTKHLNSLYINAIHPLKGDSLLIGTRQGVRIFNKRTGVFITDTIFAMLNNEVISCICPDEYNRLWIASSSNVFVYDKGKLYTAAAYMPASIKMERQGYSLAAFAWDKVRKGFWVGGDVTYFIDCRKNLVYNKKNAPFHSPFLDSSSCYTVAIDSKNNLWFGCNDNPSLNFWDCRTNKVDSYYEMDGIKWQSNGANRIFIDHKDRVWISTWLFAAFLKEPGKPIKKIPFSQSQTYSIGYGHFRDAIEDAEGNVWLGTINGLSKSQAQDPFQAIYQLPSFNFFLETGFAQANYVGIDSNTIMACKEEGIIAYNMNERSYKRYIVSATDDVYRNRFTMATKSGTTWWFAGADGVYYLEEGATSLKHFDQTKKSTEANAANFIFTDAKGNIWFQVVHEALYRYNPVTKKTDRFDGKDPAHGLFDFNPCNGFVVLKNNDIIFGMYGAGLLKFDAGSEKFSVIPLGGKSNLSINDMKEDGKGNIWAAINGRGILKIDQQGKCIDSINTSNGLTIDNITSLAIDGRGFIWAGCREGLMFFNPSTKDLTKVEIDLGQTLQDYWNSINIFNGKVYAVMLDHVVVIDPFLFEAIHVKDPPHITSVKIFGKEITDEINEDVIRLSPNEDYVTFQFASLNHREVPSLQYSYQLEGVDKNWVNFGRNLAVSYNNLLPGTYTFKVRSTDEHGKWMEKISSLKIHVELHWWQSWWFLSLCILIGILLLVIIYKNALRRRGKRNIDRTIDYFANSVYGENSVNEICWDIARNCISQLQFEDCVVYLLDEERQVLLQKAAYGPKNPKGHEIVDPIEISSGFGIVGTVWATGKAQLIGDTTKDKRYVIDDVKRNSEISVPIFHDGKVIGVIDSEHSQKNFFTESHLKALTTIASISANKIAEANAEEMAKQNEIKLLEINKMLAESQLMALRAQMNPHFVFNCLNSIQECIVTQKYGEASKYLNKFSKLFRTVLNNSGKKLVSIDEEKEVLELYLELEQMRFEQSFTYEMYVDEELEIDEILLPSMLLQPYVENALWHGLMHRDGERKMKIEFRRINEELFRCTIDDNGIGRKASFALKEQQSKAKRHESKGLQISKDRLDLLERQGYHASLNIIDKYDVSGNALGTRVEIELSTYLKNI